MLSFRQHSGLCWLRRVRRLGEFWFGLLEQFKERRGSLSECPKDSEAGWVHPRSTGLETRDTIEDSMSPERKQRLDDIGFVWDASH